MKFGITNKGFRRLARSVQSMPFLAEPPMASGETYSGIEEFPGFHTADTFEIAAAYAVGRVSHNMTEEDELGGHYVTDYPVVVQIDMSGFTPTTDYDAEKMVKEPMVYHLQELISNYNLTVNSDDDEIFEAGQAFMDMGESSDEYTDWSKPYDAIFTQTFSHFNDPLSGLIGDDRFPELVREFIRTGEIDPQYLMEASGQYRYTEDVSEENLRAVWFVQPVAEEAVTYENEEDEEFLESWEGFDIASDEDLMGGSFNYMSELVYGEATAGTQYHGTTYKRLLQAAPNLEGILPDPPSPPYKG
jgi:hypothetical protein